MGRKKKVEGPSGATVPFTSDSTSSGQMANPRRSGAEGAGGSRCCRFYRHGQMQRRRGGWGVTPVLGTLREEEEASAEPGKESQLPSGLVGSRLEVARAPLSRRKRHRGVHGTDTGRTTAGSLARAAPPRRSGRVGRAFLRSDPLDAGPAAGEWRHLVAVTSAAGRPPARPSALRAAAPGGRT